MLREEIQKAARGLEEIETRAKNHNRAIMLRGEIQELKSRILEIEGELREIEAGKDGNGAVDEMEGSTSSIVGAGSELVTSEIPESVIRALGYFGISYSFFRDVAETATSTTYGLTLDPEHIPLFLQLLRGLDNGIFEIIYNEGAQEVTVSWEKALRSDPAHDSLPV